MNKSLLDTFVPSKVLSQALQLDAAHADLIRWLVHSVFPFTRVKFKRNEWLVVSATKVTIECFFKKIFNSYVYLSMDNDTINNSKGNLVCKFPYFRKYSEITNISWPILHFYSFVTIFSKLQTSQVKYLNCVLIHQNIDIGIEYFQFSTQFWRFSAETTSHSFRLNFTPCIRLLEVFAWWMNTSDSRKQERSWVDDCILTT